MTVVATFPKLAHDWLVHELDASFSRAAHVIASGTGLVTTGMVLGQVTATKKLKKFDPAAVDGTQNAFAILINNADATSADAETAVTVRDTVIVPNQLTWIAGVTSPQKDAALAQLAAKGILSQQR